MEKRYLFFLVGKFILRKTTEVILVGVRSFLTNINFYNCRTSVVQVIHSLRPEPCLRGHVSKPKINNTNY